MKYCLVYDGFWLNMYVSTYLSISQTPHPSKGTSPIGLATAEVSKVPCFVLSLHTINPLPANSLSHYKFTIFIHFSCGLPLCHFPQPSSHHHHNHQPLPVYCGTKASPSVLRLSLSDVSALYPALTNALISPLYLVLCLP